MQAQIAAYHERESMDPMTGAEGILRDEWRVREIGLEESNAVRDWSGGICWDGWMLEHRYIRRGTVEPWEYFDVSNCREYALADIDPKAIAIDPDLLKIQQTRQMEAEQAEIARQAKEQAERERMEAKALEVASNAAFVRLRASKHGHLADAYNAFVASKQGDQAYFDKVQADQQFMTLYKAVFNAVTVPTKRKAIRLFLEYAA